MPTMTLGIHVLGIESSCDDTGVAIVRNDGKVLSNCVKSQLKQHLDHGGIIPMVAREYHMNNIDSVARQAVQTSGIKSIASQIDAIAVTTRPGLDYSLQVGLNYAIALAKKYSKPLIPIHHMQAHALMPLLEHPGIKFPFITLLLSGGHCLLAMCKRFNEFHLLGCSADDAPGDLLDKVGRRCRLRNLGPPFDSLSGGAAIELLSKREDANRFKYFNRQAAIPMSSSQSCDFSFSGYRGTFDDIALIIDQLWLNGDRDALMAELGHVSGSIQRAMLIQIVKRLQRAIVYYRMFWRHHNESAFSDKDDSVRAWSDSDYPDIVVSGGVAANEYLLNNLQEICNHCIDESIKVYAPSKSLCSDNGLMIAWNGMIRYLDYLKHGSCNKDLDESIIEDQERFNLLQTKSASPIGMDLRQQVIENSVTLAGIRHSEIKISQ